MTANTAYTALASLLNAVEEIQQNFATGTMDEEMVAHLVERANSPEIREIARKARRAAEFESAMEKI